MALRPDRACLVTGSASGIGRRLVTRLLKQGHRVFATDLRLDALSQAAQDERWPAERHHAYGLDVADGNAWTAAVEEAVSRLGGIDLAFNVAGYLAPGYVVDFTVDDVHRHLDVNAKGVIFGTAAVARVMQPRGHIVNIGSLASLAPVPGLPLYAASKYAVRGFSLAAAAELRKRGIAVTVVCPDAVETPMLAQQRGREEAALTFSGPRSLTVDEVCDLILGPVLRSRPVEAWLPLSRGILARLGDLFPALAQRVEPWLRRRGLRRM